MMQVCTTIQMTGMQLKAHTADVEKELHIQPKVLFCYSSPVKIELCISLHQHRKQRQVSYRGSLSLLATFPGMCHFLVYLKIHLHRSGDKDCFALSRN